LKELAVRGPNVGRDQEEVTLLLNKLGDGDQNAAAQLVPLVYEELRRMASQYLRRERPGHTLQATALVHEAYIKLAGQRDAQWQNRAHFFGVASELMRRILVDYARAQLRSKRGGKQQKVSLDDMLLVSPDRTDELLVVNDALARLEAMDPRQGRIVELRYFGGLTVDETAEVLHVSSKTVLREWNLAKAWLYGNLKEHHADDARELEAGKDAV
jgi:RNA polymerase sigma factor (TIGR02999 family)